MKVAFMGDYSLNDLVVADNGNQIVPVSVLNFAGSTAGFGIDEDMDGVKRLTYNNKVAGSPYTVTIMIQNVPTIVPNVELIGGRPPVIRK